MADAIAVRPPRLFITRELLEEARDEGIRGIAASGPSIKTVLERGSRGALRGVAVGQLVLHGLTKLDDPNLKVFRVMPHEAKVTSLQVSDRPGISIEELVEHGLPETHTLPVPIKAFEGLSAAWGIHNSAKAYTEHLGRMQPDGQELHAPDGIFGVPALDTALRTGVHLFGQILSRSMPEDRRETPESLADQMLKRIGPIISRGAETIRTVQGMPEQQVAPLRPDEMATLVEQDAPLVFVQPET